MSDVEQEAGKDVGKVGSRKAAAFLLALDSDNAASVMRNLNPAEVTRITEQMARMEQISGKEMDTVMEEFRSSVEQVAIEPLLEDLLVKALGPEKARELLERIRRRHRETEPFKALRRLSPSQLELILRGEHPQVLALVIGHLKADIAYEILRTFDENLRYDVIRRIALTEELPSEMVRQVDAVLEARAVEVASQANLGADRNRFQTIAQMLNLAEVGMSKTIMERLGKDLPDAAEEVQSLMFVFEDLVKIGDRDMQKILSDLDKADLAMALKTASEQVKEKILGNLSKRAKENLVDEIAMLGPKPLAEVEEAQKRIVETVRSMEERGELSLKRSGEEMV